MISIKRPASIEKVQMLSSGNLNDGDGEPKKGRDCIAAASIPNQLNPIFIDTRIPGGLMSIFLP
jgi:hypothetical protein